MSFDYNSLVVSAAYDRGQRYSWTFATSCIVFEEIICSVRYIRMSLILTCAVTSSGRHINPHSAGCLLGQYYIGQPIF